MKFLDPDNDIVKKYVEIVKETISNSGGDGSALIINRLYEFDKLIDMFQKHIPNSIKSTDDVLYLGEQEYIIFSNRQDGLTGEITIKAPYNYDLILVI